MKIQKYKKGFTLIELLFSIWILIFLFTIGNYGYLKKQREIDFEITADEIRSLLYEAREWSRNYKNESVYGVHLTTSSYAWFKGATYTSTWSILSGTLNNFITIEEINLNWGGNDLVFEKNTGNTNNYGHFKLKNNDGTSALFEINNLGFISLTYGES